jgi:hypothetical protein
MMLNVRGGSWFVEKPYEPQWRRLDSWLRGVSTGRLLILEIGAGFSTPSVIRWPCEALASRNPNAHLIRVNLEYPELPHSLGNRGTAIGARGADLLRVLSSSPRA